MKNGLQAENLTKKQIGAIVQKYFDPDWWMMNHPKQDLYNTLNALNCSKHINILSFEDPNVIVEIVCRHIEIGESL